MAALPVTILPGWYSINVGNSPNALTPNNKALGGTISAASYDGTSQAGAGQYVLFEKSEDQIEVQNAGGLKFFLVRSKDIIYIENIVTPP